MKRVDLSDNEFSIEVYEANEVCLNFIEYLKLFGKASTEAGDKLVDEIAISFSKNCSVILDCSNLEYINSTVVCMILAENRKAKEKGLKIVIVHPYGLVKEIFEMLGLTDKAIEIRDKLEDALLVISEGEGRKFKTQIICTLGTATDDNNVIKEMIKCGMSYVKVNVVYTELNDYKRRINQVREIANIPIIVDLEGPQLTDKDLSAMDFLIQNKVESFALSSVRNIDDILCLNNIIKEKSSLIDKGYKWSIIAKIENSFGVNNIRDIIEKSLENKIDISIMVVREDLYVELPFQQLACIQKKIIKICNEYNVPVIIATGLLESMQYNTMPVCSEVCDVTNAILDGANGLLLSKEVSDGKNPALVVKTLGWIIDSVSSCFEPLMNN